MIAAGTIRSGPGQATAGENGQSALRRRAPRRARVGPVASVPYGIRVLNDIVDLEDLQSLAGDLAYELRALAASDCDAQRRDAALAALEQLDRYEAEADAEGVQPLAQDANPPEVLQGLREIIEGGLQEALEAYCEPWMRLSWRAGVGYGFEPDLEGLQEAARADDGVLAIEAGSPWPDPWTAEGRSLQYVMEVNDHGNVSLYDRNHREIWSCV